MIPDGWLQDVRTALRGLVRAPGFATAALVTLGLGIGATSAIFTVVRSVLLAPLPYSEPDRRVLIWNRWVNFDKTWLSDQEVLDYRQMSRTMTAVAGWGTGQQNLTGAGEPLRIGVGFVTANTFDVLGARPLLGRAIREDEDRPNAAPVAVLGHDLWQGAFGGDRGVIGRRILLDDVPVDVVGVMPPGFRLPTDFTVDAAEPTQLWRPLQIDPASTVRGSHGYYGAAVLAPGETAASATEDLRAITRQLTDDGFYPPQMAFTAFATSLDEEIRGGVRPAMWLVAGAVAFLLLIACVNVANLLLVRGDGRLREMAVRTAVGAAPARLARQLLVESLVLAAGGALVGLVIAAAGVRALVALDPSDVPRVAPVALDGAVIGFTLVVSVATTLVFGLVPALRTARFNLVEPLREGGHQATLGGRRLALRGALVAVEVALAVVLVVGAGLMIRSLNALDRIDLGFRPDGVLTMRLALPAAAYDSPAKVVGFFRELLTRVRGLPGVEHAGVVRVLPLATTIGDFGLDIDGYDERHGHNAQGDWQIVSDGAFEAMGTRLVRGRWFTPAETTDSEPVAVVNETLARTYWPDGQALDGRLRVGSNPGRPWFRVVGIVADERHNGVTGLVKGKFYIPHAQWHIATGGGLVRNAFVVARTAGDPLALAAPIREQIRQMDAHLPVASLRPMTDVVAAALATPRLTGVLLGAFAFIALALAGVGIYGVLAYLVARRAHEFGIRMAVGADRAQVVRLVLGQGLAMAAIGVGMGIVAAAALARLMRRVLYGVEPLDPLTFAAVPAVLGVVAVAAAVLPALRATRVSPVAALRAD
ncbi:MAG: ABC transporter permease [Acidobacteriota bacterium]